MSKTRKQNKRKYEDALLSFHPGHKVSLGALNRDLLSHIFSFLPLAGQSACFDTSRMMRADIKNYWNVLATRTLGPHTSWLEFDHLRARKSDVSFSRATKFYRLTPALVTPLPSRLINIPAQHLYVRLFNRLDVVRASCSRFGTLKALYKYNEKIQKCAYKNRNAVVALQRRRTRTLLK